MEKRPSPCQPVSENFMASSVKKRYSRPGKHTKSELENGPFIVDLPIKNGALP
jgi:hypothetical protein